MGSMSIAKISLHFEAGRNGFVVLAFVVRELLLAHSRSRAHQGQGKAIVRGILSELALRPTLLY